MKSGAALKAPKPKQAVGKTVVLALHGRGDADSEGPGWRRLLERAKAELRGGARAIDVATQLLRGVESYSLAFAPPSARRERSGQYEFAASLVDGSTSKSASIVGLRSFCSPIMTARAAFDADLTVLAGRSATEFAIQNEAADPSSFCTRFAEAHAVVGRTAPVAVEFGCVVLDQNRCLASACTGASVVGKKASGECAGTLVGPGLWADDSCAVSLLSSAKFSVPRVAAALVGIRARSRPLGVAARYVFTEMSRSANPGSLMAIDVDGDIHASYSAPGHWTAVLYADGYIRVGRT